MSEPLTLFEKLALGRAVRHTSVSGHAFVSFPDAADGEWRRCIIPDAWYSMASRADSRQMHRLPGGAGWDFWSTRAQLAADISTTFDQMNGGDGSVSEVRLLTLQRLVTTEEWEEAEEAWRQGVAARTPR